MNPSEELMLLLELNGYDVKKFKLKKQLEFEKTGNRELYLKKTLKDLLVSHYSFTGEKDPLRQNPLAFQAKNNSVINSIDQFYVTHPDLLDNVTLKDVITSNEFDEVHKESVLYDIMDGWVEEYRESSIVRMENLKEMIQLLPKKSKKYKKPSLFTLFFALLLAYPLMLLYVSPESLQSGFFPFVGVVSTKFRELIMQLSWYSFLGSFTIYLLIAYAITNSFFRRYMKDIRSEKNKHSDRIFEKWDNDMKRLRLEQSGLLEDYVDRVLRKPKMSNLDLKLLSRPERLMSKLKAYVMMVERKYDRMTKYYYTYRLAMRLMFLLALLMLLSFIGLGFALMWGWL